jgi:putative peptidoglycan lipid II flippase
MTGSEMDQSAGRDAGVQAPGKGASSLSLAALLMMAGLLLSKLTGQLREILIVPVLGYGVVSDAFVIGFQIPDLFYQLLIGGAIQAAITPTLAAALEKQKEKRSWHSISIFINLAALAMLIAVLVGELLSPVIIPLYNSSKVPEISALAVQVSRALFPQAFFMMLAAFSIGILNAYKKFSSTAFGPSIYNVFVILAMILLGQASPSGAVRVASGIMVAACLFFIMQFTLARKEFCYYTFSFDHRDKGFRQLLYLALPTMLSGSIVQINAIIMTAFADQFEGAATSLRQATTTWQLPYGIFAVAIGNVMLPSLAGIRARQDHKAGRRLLTRSLRSTLFLTIPSAALFLAMQQDVIRAIFQWSSTYSDKTVGITASILKWYCLAIVAQSVVFIINQAFYACRQTRIALFNGLLTLALNSFLCLMLTRWVKLGVDSLSLAYMVTSIISSALLYYMFRRLFPQYAPRRLWPFWVRASICASVLLVIVLLLNLLPFQPETKFLQLLWFGLRALAGIVGYLAAAIFLKMPEAQTALEKIKTILKKSAALLRFYPGGARKPAAISERAGKSLGHFAANIKNGAVSGLAKVVDAVKMLIRKITGIFRHNR